MRFTRTCAGLAIACAAMAVPLAAQQPVPQSQPSPQVPDSIQAMVQEFQALRQRVGAVQDSAFAADPGLVEAREEIQSFVRDRMMESNPDLGGDVDRLEALQEEASEAQAAQDTTRLREIVEEGTRIQRELSAVQATTMETEDVQERVDAFEGRVVEAMTAIDPEIDEALARLEEIAGTLQEFQQGG